jgi:hypothetical protein
MRLSKVRQPAFGQVELGDRLFLKGSSGPICGVATVADIKCYEDLTPQRVTEIKRRYNSRIVGDDALWQSKMDCRFGFLIWLADVRRIGLMRIAEQDWRGWVVLAEGKDFGLLRETGLWETVDASDP